MIEIFFVLTVLVNLSLFWLILTCYFNIQDICTRLDTKLKDCPLKEILDRSKYK